jgi:formate-dependent nitrite reductase membrane component NrfD
MTANSDKRVRYPETLDPVTTDGRDVDTSLAVLAGEASHQEAKQEDRHIRDLSPDPWERVPEITAADTTYYDRPMLKESVWSVDIPLYYFVGGAAGAALTLGAALQLATPCGGHELRRLSSICHWTGIVGSTAGAAFLIHDLGRPSRFLYMMRVFRPTSPMNVGVWILGSAAPSAIVTGLLVNRPGPLGMLGEIAGYISGLFGAALSGYTGVLVSNTAIPIFQESRRWMPVLFVASSAATAASVIDVFAGKNKKALLTTWIFGTGSRLAEIAAAREVERAASTIPKVGEPFREGTAALLWKTATVLSAASFALSLVPVKSRKKRHIVGFLGIAGSFCLRFAVHYLGNASARDPRSSFQQQRTPEAR